jgi:aminoacyl tRNA synthase complex-interacting multifunctional protein 1
MALQIHFIYFCKIKGKSTGDTEPTKAKAKAAKPAGKEVAEKETELSVSLLNIQVGLIRKAWKHPSADRSFGKPT